MDLIPFREKWVGSQTKLDLQGWYRRPSIHGGFSLVGPLPLRRHLDWTRKGFEYVTLASAADAALVVNELKAEGIDISGMAKSYDHRGHFKIQDYLKEAQATDTAYLADLQTKVDKYGAETVIEMMRLSDPGFTLPEGIVVTEPVKGGKK